MARRKSLMAAILIAILLQFAVPAVANAKPAAAGRQSATCNAAIDIWWTPNVGPAVAAWAKRIVWREAGNQPWAANRRSSARGCFQLLQSLHARRYNKFRGWGCSPAKWNNADCNSLAALDLYRQAGKSPWRL